MEKFNEKDFFNNLMRTFTKTMNTKRQTTGTTARENAPLRTPVLKIVRAACIVLAAAGALALAGFGGCHNPAQTSGYVYPTLDTTSHNFSWVMDTLGTKESYLTGVSIINDTCVWVTGEIHNDSTDIQTPNGCMLPYFNAARWDGQIWHYYRIGWDTCSAISAINSIFAFNSNDIWADIVHYNGIIWEKHDLSAYSRLGYQHIIWGTSYNNIFFGFDSGSVLHWNGNSFTQYNLGNNQMVYDIWGAIDPATNEQIILCVCSSDQTSNSEIYQFNNNEFTSIVSLYGQESGIWFESGYQYYVVGGMDIILIH